MITRTIDRNFANMRLDRFLRKAFPDESLSVFFAVLRKKKVRVNGVVGKANQMLAEGDVVNIYENFKSVAEEERDGTAHTAKPAETTAANPGWGKPKTEKEKNAAWGVSKKLDIVIQTEDYVIVNKPSGLASQPGSGTRPGESLVEYLWEWGNEEGLDFRPTIAHRLDQETSGLLIAALHGDTLRELTRLIREHEVDKFYYALVKGNLKRDKGTIDESLTRTDAAKGSKMKVGETGKDAQRAITHYRVKQHYEGYDLVKIKSHAPDPCPFRKHRPPALGRHPLRRLCPQPRSQKGTRVEPAVFAQLPPRICVEGQQDCARLPASQGTR